MHVETGLSSYSKVYTMTLLVNLYVQNGMQYMCVCLYVHVWSEVVVNKLWVSGVYEFCQQVASMCGGGFVSVFIQVAGGVIVYVEVLNIPSHTHTHTQSIYM